jgi:hypothetical protein
MGEKIIVGPVNKGLRNDRTAFIIDNDAFPTLINAYQWRGRIKRKRGTAFLGQLNRYIATTDGSGDLSYTITPIPANGTSMFVIGKDVFLDPGGTGTVTLITNSAGSGTLVRTTGVLTITGSKVSTKVYYFPGQPVMGIEDLVLNANQFPGTLGFDTQYSYNIPTSWPFVPYDVSFYKNPPTGAYSGYTGKGTAWTPTSWNGLPYQQFWSCNYAGAFWATNGITDPFTTTNIGMQFAPSATITFNSRPSSTTINITINPSPLVVGDFVFLNEWTDSSTPANAAQLNFQTGYVTSASDPGGNNTLVIKLPNTNLSNDTFVPGIVQYLTNRSDPTKDCIRWYDGDPTAGSPPIPGSSGGPGWVNFCPPLISGPNNVFVIEDQPPGQYYLVGAKMIVPFKGRLLFIGPVIQTSSAGSQVFLQDTVIYSQVGTPYYTASFQPPITSDTQYQPILVPTNQTATADAFFEDVTGYGGFVSAGYAQPINTVVNNEDTLLMGFSNRFARFVSTGNGIDPFLFYVINSEFGATSTFSAITVDRGGYTFGNYGILITSQIESQRIDLEIPDQIFQLKYMNNGAQRVCAQRDYINEWIYFTYLSNNNPYNYPNQTLQYNYRDASWAIFNESYTTYGTFRESSGLTWATAGEMFGTWEGWNQAWNAGSSTVSQPQVIAGNQQGFIVFRGVGTEESVSLSIQNLVGSTVTSPNHGLGINDELDDYILINGVLGTLGSQVNGKVFSVQSATMNTFVLNPAIAGGTYMGGGQITRLYVPQILTKQFPTWWQYQRKTRLGPQMYLFTTTGMSQITLQIFLSQNQDIAFNYGPIVPSPDVQNDSLVYSDILYTCQESTNIGLTPANTNLQQQASPQAQTWHRMNTSLIGDTVQIGFTMSDAQMRALDTDNNPYNAFAEIELHSVVLDVAPSQMLS